MKHARSDYDERIQDSAGLIPDDEPVLLIRGQDIAALPALDVWCQFAEEAGADPRLVESVREHGERIREWQEKHVKVPDAPEGVLSDGADAE